MHCVYSASFCYIRRLHKLFVGNGADGMEPSFHRLITAFGSGIPVNMKHGQQVYMLKSNLGTV